MLGLGAGGGMSALVMPFALNRFPLHLSCSSNSTAWQALQALLFFPALKHIIDTLFTCTFPRGSSTTTDFAPLSFTRNGSVTGRSLTPAGMLLPTQTEVSAYPSTPFRNNNSQKCWEFWKEVIGEIAKHRGPFKRASLSDQPGNHWVLHLFPCFARLKI